jgi:hypothetical protein
MPRGCRSRPAWSTSTFTGITARRGRVRGRSTRRAHRRLLVAKLRDHGCGCRQSGMAELRRLQSSHHRQIEAVPGWSWVRQPRIASIDPLPCCQRRRQRMRDCAAMHFRSDRSHRDRFCRGPQSATVGPMCGTGEKGGFAARMARFGVTSARAECSCARNSVRKWPAVLSYEIGDTAETTSDGVEPAWLLMERLWHDHRRQQHPLRPFERVRAGRSPGRIPRLARRRSRAPA